ASHGNPLGDARSHEAGILLDAAGPQGRLDAAATGRRPGAAEPGQPARRVRATGAAGRNRGSRTQSRSERGDRRHIASAPHSGPGGRTMNDLLQVHDLSVRFATPGGHIDAVKHVTFRLRPASTVALVGESGSGKSAVSQAILRILPRNGTIASGEILFDDPRSDRGPVDLSQLAAAGRQMRALRGGSISIVFQEPMSSLSPLHTVGDQVGEALALHRECSGPQGKELTIEMLRLVGFPDPPRAWRSYPFEL